MSVFRFSQLPSELRSQIWHLALEHWCVIKVGFPELRPVGWDQYVIGRVCWEARIIMKKKCKEFALGSTTWINLQSTVLFFDTAKLGPYVIAHLNSQLCSDMKHAAFMWSSWPEVRRCLELMSTKCHSLKSILIVDAGRPRVNWAYEPSGPDLRPSTPQEAERVVAFLLDCNLKHEPVWMNGDADVIQLHRWFSSDPTSSSLVIKMIPPWDQAFLL
ncbi:hypothetical protein NPX13_g1642 [Xylaria arbuscula]|uniref:2EXR domain-containing protein n=1 Tax=Xylaria arbuscula TaxID=114810 RepID=A0A9W8NKP5_9PEZI|nr:hypothetical protein NPX13_g1642 [Xylaria arbuscula]